MRAASIGVSCAARHPHEVQRTRKSDPCSSMSAASGVPQIGSPNTGSGGQLRSSSVEASNVDLTEELVDMITAQRVYQANAQTIKTQDSVLQTLVNLR